MSSSPDRKACTADDFCPAQSVWIGLTTQEFPFAILTDKCDDCQLDDANIDKFDPTAS